ncbi:hypothetical protein LXL04_004803 [Taraxacum kok-saghyz]
MRERRSWSKGQEDHSSCCFHVARRRDEQELQVPELRTETAPELAVPELELPQASPVPIPNIRELPSAIPVPIPINSGTATCRTVRAFGINKSHIHNFTLHKSKIKEALIAESQRRIPSNRHWHFSIQNWNRAQPSNRRRTTIDLLPDQPSGIGLLPDPPSRIGIFADPSSQSQIQVRSRQSHHRASHFTVDSDSISTGDDCMNQGGRPTVESDPSSIQSSCLQSRVDPLDSHSSKQLEIEQVSISSPGCLIMNDQEPIDVHGQNFVGVVKNKQMTKIYDEFYENDVDDAMEKSELEEYLQSPPEKMSNESFEILRWWSDKCTTYKVLASMAKDILAIPVSTVASESAFSTSGRVIDDFRSNLGVKTVETLICTQDWLRGTNVCIDLEQLLEDVEKYEKVPVPSSSEQFRAVPVPVPKIRELLQAVPVPVSKTRKPAVPVPVPVPGKRGKYLPMLIPSSS